jgi:peptide/nickel transport system permease protein
MQQTSAVSGESVSPAVVVAGKRTPTHLAWRRFLRHRLAVAGVMVMFFLVTGAVLAPFLSTYGPYKTNIQAMRKPPSVQHLLGTDELGRDVFSRLLYGGRVSLSVGLVAVSISVTIGIVLGSISGYYGGRVDDILVRITEAIMCFPRLVIILTLVSVVGPSIYKVMVVIGLLSWPGTYRLVRSQFFSLREQEFVTAARVAGANNRRVIFRHCLPNTLSPVIVSATLGVAGAILTEASLGFLGLGVPPPFASWGNMLNAAQGLTQLERMQWLWVPPAALISLAVISINLIGDALRDALDPRMTLS